MPVHLYGHPCEMDCLLDLARQHQLAVVEDAAHAFPAKYRGRPIGSLPPASAVGEAATGVGVKVLTAFSFYATKNLTTAEGGMLTGDPDSIEQARLWSLHGMSHDAYQRYNAEGSWYYEVVLPGYKCNMTDIQAALGLQQLRKMASFQARRRAIVQQYQAAFAALPELQIPTERAEAEHAWHLYALRLNLERLTIDRARFIEELKQRNIGTSVHFIPIHLHPYYRDKYGWRPDDFSIAYREYRRLISLPLYPRLSDQDVNDVVEVVRNVVQEYRTG